MIPELSLKDGRVKKYKRIGYVLLTVVLFMLGSLFFYKGSEKDKGVKVGEAVEQGQNTIQIVNMNYYEDRELLQLGVYFQTNKIDPLNPIQPVARKTKNTFNSLDLEVEKITDDYYQIFVKSVKKNWDHIYIALYTKSEVKSFISSTELFPVAEKYTNSETKFEPKSKQEYLKILYKFLEEEARKKVKQSEKTIQNTKEDIKVLEESINEIKESLSLKTSEQRTSDETKISQNQTKINTLTQSIEEEQKRVKEQKEMIKQYQKLTEKTVEK
ncbi:hypothetical protein [Enterococcus faecalis]|uniref:hypothetical protein n=1 Tax=Enterococcus faecalis TaxID=1351 RepID=UPI002737F430|nr:hypothetical protein [Enterococcus faecalis]